MAQPGRSLEHALAVASPPGSSRTPRNVRQRARPAWSPMSMLMSGMNVGDLFGAGKMFLLQVVEACAITAGGSPPIPFIEAEKGDKPETRARS